MDFSTIAQKLIDAAHDDIAGAVELCRELCPAIVSQIQTDSARRGPLSFWGRSTNFDELANQTIVDPVLISLLSQITRKKISVKTPHAGLQHTYGYLLSLIQTPYGMKRDRWTEAKLESAFGLNKSTLGPSPQQGTLLTNATWLAGQIAFRNVDKSLDRLRRYLSGKYSPDLDRIDFDRLPQVRIVENVTLKTTPKRPPKSWSLQTDLVSASANVEFNVLIYSVTEEHTGNASLITLFPIGQETRQELLARTQSTTRDDIRLRFNAYVPALFGGVFEGTCEAVEF